MRWLWAALHFWSPQY